MSKRFEDYARGARAIIVVAERLFGKYGLDGVSLRQIVVAAGQVNPSAVQHHFGSKKGLIQAVYEMREPAIEEARRVKLEALKKGKRSSVDELLAALLEPLIEVLPKPQRFLYARFMLRLLPLSDAEHPHFSAPDICAPSNEIMERMLARFSRLAPDIVTARTRMAVSIFLQGICDERRVRGLASHAYKTEEIFWDEIYQMALSIFANPYPPPLRFSARAPGGRGKLSRRKKAKARIGISRRANSRIGK
jgi:AcrR family transcriptional regulator